jgi:transcriptional regulator with XRE-family HTH domain
LTQKDLAEKLNTTNIPTISGYENIAADVTSGFPTLNKACEIANALNCSLDWLVGLSDIEKPQPANDVDDADIEERIRKETQYLIDAFDGEMLLYQTDIQVPSIVPQDWIADDMHRFFENYKKRCSSIDNLQEDSQIDESLIESLKDDVIDKFVNIAAEKHYKNQEESDSPHTEEISGMG